MASGTLFIKPATMCSSAASSLCLVLLLKIDHPRLPSWLSGIETMQETRVQSLIQEDPTCGKATKLMCLSHNY